MCPVTDSGAALGAPCEGAGEPRPAPAKDEAEAMVPVKSELNASISVLPVPRRSKRSAGGWDSGHGQARNCRRHAAADGISRSRPAPLVACWHVRALDGDDRPRACTSPLPQCPAGASQRPRAYVYSDNGRLRDGLYPWAPDAAPGFEEVRRAKSAVPDAPRGRGALHGHRRTVQGSKRPALAFSQHPSHVPCTPVARSLGSYSWSRTGRGRAAGTACL